MDPPPPPGGITHILKYHNLAPGLTPENHSFFYFPDDQSRPMATYTLLINGNSHTFQSEPDRPLLWVLRDTLELKGTKYGCGIGFCGACTVHIGETAVRSCSIPVSAVQGAVTTIEGLSRDGSHPLQLMWMEMDVAQCGYCQAGQIMSAAALLHRNKNPNREEIHAAMQGNLCRCGTYLRIRQAIERVLLK